MLRMPTIAIDGPVAAGKSVVGQLLAKHLGFRFLDTGFMYRAITWASIQRGITPENEEALVGLAGLISVDLSSSTQQLRVFFEGLDVTALMRDQLVDRAVSSVARIPSVRKEMVAKQRKIANPGKIVMVGRDIGTIVLPDASVKIFLCASADERATRRYKELINSGKSPSFAAVKEDLLQRDRLDSQRIDSPLKQAQEAIMINSDGLDIEEVVNQVLTITKGHL